MSKVLGIALVAVAMVSCSSSDELNEGGNYNNEIRFSSRINQLRSVPYNDTQLEAGTKVGIYVVERTDANTPGNPNYGGIYENVQLEASGSGDFSSSMLMYYPSTGNNVDFFAYHPWQADNITEVGALSFNVQADQTELENYIQSDLLWAQTLNINNSNYVVPLTFQHKLSKFEFVLKKGDGITDFMQLNKLEVLDILPGTTLDVETGEITEATGAAVNISAFGATATTEEEASTSAAILVPQTLPINKQLIRITLGEATYTYTLPSALVLESGKKYTFNITLNADGIEVTSTITDWIDGGSLEGSGDMD